MTLRLSSPTCGFVLNGLDCNLISRDLRDPDGNQGPWGYPTLPGPMRSGASCRDIFLCDVMNFSHKTGIWSLNHGRPTYAFMLTGHTTNGGVIEPALRQEILAGREASIKALEKALYRYFTPSRASDLTVTIAQQDDRFDADQYRLVVAITLPKEYWGSMLMASWMAAVCRTWLHLGVSDPSEEIHTFWEDDRLEADKAKYDWAGVPDKCRFTLYAADMKVKQFSTMVKIIGKAGCPMMNPSMHLNQTTWAHYFQAYFGLSEALRKCGKSVRWASLGTGPLGCTSVFQSFTTPHEDKMYFIFMARALVYPTFPNWIGAEINLRTEAFPEWLKDGSKDKPALSAGPEAQIAAAITLQSTQTDIRIATRAATVARRAGH